MDINVKILIQVYKDEVARLQNENIVLKAQLLQLQEEQKVKEPGDKE